MKKRKCWFWHNHNTLIGYKLEYPKGKIANRPKTLRIVQLLQCEDCRHTEKLFLKYHPYETAKEKVELLNKLNNFKPDYSQIVFTSESTDSIW